MRAWTRAATVWAVCITSAAAGEPAGRLPVLWERLVEVLPSTISLIDTLRGVSPVPLPSRRILMRCRERLARESAACARGRPVERVGCAGVFARAFRTFAGAHAPGAPFAQAAEEASRASLLLRRIDREGCATPAAGSDVPAVLALADHGAALRVEPARPLDRDAIYHVGLPQIAKPVSNDEVVTSTVPTELLAATAPDVHPFLARLYHAAAQVPGVTVRPSLLVPLSQPLGLRSAQRVRIAFRRSRPARSTGLSIQLRTTAGHLRVDARRGRAAGRKTARGGDVRVLPAGSPQIASLGIASETLPHVGRWVVGRFVSRDVHTGRSTRVPFVVTVPRDHMQATVLLLHGLGGTSRAFLVRRADDLAARGLAAAAFDLPGHGGRAESTPFLDSLDPARFAHNLRQARIDAFALASALRTVLPDVLPRDAPIRLLGYSLGGMIGTHVLAGDADIEAGVLVAPAGDLFDFLGLRVAQSLGLPLLTCAGGTRAGEACKAGDACPGGVCAPNAALYPFAHIATPYRTVVADADPQTAAAEVAGPQGRRPVLIQEGEGDYIVHNSNTAWLAAAIDADMTCRLREGAPQTLCHFRGALHDLVNLPVPQAQAHDFIASGGRRLLDGGDARAAR